MLKIVNELMALPGRIRSDLAWWAVQGLLAAGLSALLGTFLPAALARAGWGWLFGIAARALLGWEDRLRLPATVGISGAITLAYYLVLSSLILPASRPLLQDGSPVDFLVVFTAFFVVPVLLTREAFLHLDRQGAPRRWLYK